LKSAVATPIVVEAQLWGAIGIGSTHGPLPEDAEERMAGFTQLVGTAIANAASRTNLASLAAEQSALRRVATLVARGAPPEKLFASVTEEAAQLLGVDFAALGRYESDGTVVMLAARGEPAASLFAVGTRLAVGGENITSIIARTGRPARLDGYGDDAGQITAAGRASGIRASVGTPIIVEFRLWGVMTAGTTTDDELPADTEARLASFTELLATAIANAESRSDLTASRARIVAAGDEARRRIERNLHDGAQQRLVSLALELRSAQAAMPPEMEDVRARLARVGDGLTHALEELRELSRGIHPAILSEGGLGPALKTLARRSQVPVDLSVDVERRLREPIEVCAYYVVSEMLANAAKHAEASAVRVGVEATEDVLLISVRDDGVGGADPASGSGLVGLRDRVDTLGGTMVLESPPGGGTSLTVELPAD
jgi:signal transduction histidine kinase